MLMGGRVLPGMAGKPAAHSMYQAAQSRPVTIHRLGMHRPKSQTASRVVKFSSATMYLVDVN